MKKDWGTVVMEPTNVPAPKPGLLPHPAPQSYPPPATAPPPSNLTRAQPLPGGAPTHMPFPLSDTHTYKLVCGQCLNEDNQHLAVYGIIKVEHQCA